MNRLTIENKKPVKPEEYYPDLRGHVEQLKKRIEYYISTTELNNVEEKSLSLLFEIHSTIDNSLCKHCNYTNEIQAKINSLSSAQVVPLPPPSAPSSNTFSNNSLEDNSNTTNYEAIENSLDNVSEDLLNFDHPESMPTSYTPLIDPPFNNLVNEPPESDIIPLLNPPSCDLVNTHPSNNQTDSLLDFDFSQQNHSTNK